MTRLFVPLMLASACSGEMGAGGDGDESGDRGSDDNSDRKPDPPPDLGTDDPDTVTPVGEATDLSEASLDELCKDKAAARARLWRLTAAQIRNTLADGLGVTVTDAQLAAFNDNRGLLFDNEADALTVRKANAASWALSASDIARASLPGVSKACGSKSAADCADPLLTFLAPRLFRRPLGSEETTRYKKLYTDTLAANKGDGDGAKVAVLSAMLQSPFFLYRSELGEPVEGQDKLVRLTPHELASALSYTLWQTAPDEALLGAAADGKLDNASGLRAQAERMLDDPRALRFFTGMLADLTNGSRMDTREGASDVKDADKLMAALSGELSAFIAAVIESNPTWKDLLTRRALPSGEAAALRGFGTASGSELTLPQPVAGMFSLGAVNFANAGTSRPSPVKRGVMLREHFLCAPVPPPPPDVMMNFASPGGDIVTNRQVYEATVSPANCKACHSLFNPFGYAFEAFDELGRYRDKDEGEPLDLSGQVDGLRDGALAFADLADLAGQLADLRQASECFALNGFRFVAGRLEAPGDFCHVRDIHETFVAADGDLVTLALALVTSDAFAYRVNDN